MARHRSTWLAIGRTPLGASAAVLLVLLAALAILAPALWGDAADQPNLDAISEGPSAEHIG